MAEKLLMTLVCNDSFFIFEQYMDFATLCGIFAKWLSDIVVRKKLLKYEHTIYSFAERD